VEGLLFIISVGFLDVLTFTHRPQGIMTGAFPLSMTIGSCSFLLRVMQRGGVGAFSDLTADRNVALMATDFSSPSRLFEVCFSFLVAWFSRA